MWTEVIFWVALALYAVLVISTATVIVLENRQPAKTIAWLVVIMLLPGAGLIFFYFFGQDLRKKYKLIRKNYDHIVRSMRGKAPPEISADTVPDYAPLIQLLHNNGGEPLTAHNSVEVLDCGRVFFLSLLQSILNAKHSIHIETYIIEEDAVGSLIADALIDKAHSGVEVRLLYDDVGCWKVPDRFFKRMMEAGIAIGAFLPVRFPRLTRRVNNRNHRKICVIDGSVGFIGGMNIALRYATDQWKDMQLRVEGDAVGQLQRIFLGDWHFTTGQLCSGAQYFPAGRTSADTMLPVQIAATSPLSRYPSIMYSFTWLLQNARRYIYLQTPYFMPSEPVLQALQTAAMMGVDVRLMLPEKPDAFWLRWANECYFTDVLRAGVKVLLYKGGFLHAKVLVCDDTCCSVGSSNMDFRSFEDNMEANAFIYDARLALEVKAVFLRDAERCEAIDPERWKRRALWRKYFESHTRILSPLL